MSGEEESQDEAARTLVRGAFVVGGLTLLSRITGLFRESIQAWILGTSFAADAFRVAFLLPNLMRRLVGEGAITSAFVPVYAEALARQGEAEGRLFAEKFLSLWLLIVGLFTVAGVVLAGSIVAIVAWGSSEGLFAGAENRELTVELTRILFWYLLLIGAVAAMQGILNARGVFGAPAFAPVAFNVTFIACAWGLHRAWGEDAAVYALAGAILIAGAAQVAVLLPALWALGIRFRPRYPFDHPGVRRVLWLLLPGTIGAGIYQINAVLSTSFAARLEEGAISSLNYSNRLMEFVLGIFVYALSTVSLTSLAKFVVAGDRRALEATLSQVLRLTTFITVPSMLGLFLLRRPILSLLFEGGKFDAHSLELTQSAFEFHVLGTLGVGWCRILVAAFHAHKDLWSPVREGAYNMALHLALVALLSSAMGHDGIALASTLASYALGVRLWWKLRRRLGGWRVQGLGRTVVGTALSSAVLVGVCLGGLALAGDPAAHGKLLGSIVLGALIASAAAAYFAAAAWLGLEEARALVGTVRARIGRSRGGGG